MPDQRRGGIPWCDVTWNVVRGCSRVSPGCQHCYAELQAIRSQAPGRAYHGLIHRRSDGRPQWTGKVRLVRDLLDRPLHWKRPRRVFVNAMSDLFHEQLPDDAIDQVFAVMVLCPQHTFQILTKRAVRMRDWSRRNATGGRIFHLAGEMGEPQSGRWPLPNVWLGVSCDDQQHADERIPFLLETPAAVRWVSAEPLLGPIRMTPDLGSVHWIVIGGESGPGARPCELDWIRSLSGECQQADLPHFIKQVGSNVWTRGLPVGFNCRGDPCLTSYRVVLKDRKGGDPSEWPEALRIREWPR